MSVVKGILGFIVGLIACGVLLFLISVKSPMTDTGTPTAPTGTPAQAVNPDAPLAQSDAQEPRVTAPAPEPVTEPVVGFEPVIDLSEDSTDIITEDPVAIEDPEEEDQTQLQTPVPVTPVTDTVIETTTPQPEVEPTQTPAPIEAPKPAPTVEKVQTAKVEPVTEPVTQTEVPVTKDETVVQKIQQGTATTLKKASSLKTVGTLSMSKGLKTLGTTNKTETGDAPALRAFDANSQSFADPEGSVVAIILTDIGSTDLTSADIIDAPFPITVAADPDNSAGVAKAAALYGAGLEVLIQNPTKGDLLVDARDDLAVAAQLDRFISAMPKAVGFLDAQNGGLKKSPAARKAVLQHFSQTGHALLLNASGIDRTGFDAKKMKVPFSRILRVLDGNGETPKIISGYLGFAVLKANQDGSVIVMGKAQKSTLEAIKTWAVGKQAANVSFVPVSAAIRLNRG